jgi:K+ transporter
MEERLEVSPLACSVWHIIAYHGYMQDCNAPKILTEASKRMGCAIDCAIENSDTFFVLPREMIVEYVGTEMPIWQRKLFGALSRNMSYAPNYFFHPMHTNRRLYLDAEGLACIATSKPFPRR